MNQHEPESLLTVPGLGDEFNVFGELNGVEMDTIFGFTSPLGSPGSPKASGGMSPGHGPGGPGLVGPGANGHDKLTGTSLATLTDVQDDPPNLLQQPLAMGFYVSTAKTGPLPKWFWSACPEREDICPTCFKVGRSDRHEALRAVACLL